MNGNLLFELGSHGEIERERRMRSVGRVPIEKRKIEPSVVCRMENKKKLREG